MWLLIACLGYALLALVSLLDKIVVSRQKVQPLAFAFFSSAILAPFLLAVPFVSQPTAWVLYAIIALAGASYAAALYTMYTSFEVGEVSHNGPLIGAITPLCTLALSQVFLNEQLTTPQIHAVALLIFGSFIISFKRNVTVRDWQVSTVMSMLAGFFFAVFFIAAKYVYETIGFGSGFVWVMAATGLAGLSLLVFPQVRAFIRANKKASKKRTQSLGIMMVDKVSAGLAVLLIQFGLANGSVVVVNALTGLQYALLIVLVAIVSKVRPSAYHEVYEHGEVMQETLAVIIIACGLGLLVV